MVHEAQPEAASAPSTPASARASRVKPNKSFENENGNNANSVLQPPRLKPKDVELLQASWSQFLENADGEEKAGQVFYELLFEKEPDMATHFTSVQIAQWSNFMRAMTRYVSLMQQPEQLRAAVEVLAFQHMNYEMDETSIFAFSEALLECVEQNLELDENEMELVMQALAELTNYIGNVITHIKESRVDVQNMLKTSWKQAQERNMQPTVVQPLEMDDMDLDYQDDEDYHSAEVPQEKEKADKTPRRTVDDSPKTAVGSNLPTSFQEMFQINAAVMGFSRSSSSWMPVVLDSVERIVEHVDSSHRVREEVQLLALRLNNFAGCALSEFKACLLAALRSTLPQLWTPKHEEAWTFLWDNVVKIVMETIERSRPYESALSKAYGGFSPGRFRKIQKEFFTAFFEIAPIGQNYFKQSLTRLLFIADKVLVYSLEILRQPKKMVSEMSALG